MFSVSTMRMPPQHPPPTTYYPAHLHLQIHLSLPTSTPLLCPNSTICSATDSALPVTEPYKHIRLSMVSVSTTHYNTTQTTDRDRDQ